MTSQPHPRRIGRLALALAALALAGASAFATWWTTTLVGLPDVGDPFDVQAFERPIPDDTNAFVLYKQAAAILPKEPGVAEYDWKSASREKREWVDRSREALAIWRRGTERPDALHIDPKVSTFDTKLDVTQDLRSFGQMALLEGSRLEDAGDFEGAFGWYRALLRSSRHCGRRGFWIERLIGIAMHRWTALRLTRWASEPRVDARLLRMALDAAIEAEASTAPLSDGLKSEYLSFLHSLDNPELMVALHDTVVSNNGPSLALFRNLGWAPGLLRVRRKSINEPERSRRVIRMIFANWLAYSDLPPSRKPPKALINPKITTKDPARALLADLYVVDATAPEAARALPPEKLANWFASTIDAEVALPAFFNVETALARERFAQANLLVTLANELHKREHGQYPERVEDLVGPYLHALPEGYTAPE